MKNRKVFVFFILLVLIIALFGVLYVYGIMNYFQKDFIKELSFLEINNKTLSMIFLIFLTIIFAVVIAIMIRIIISIKDERIELTTMNIDDFSIKKESNENVSYSLDKIINSLNKNLVAIQKFTDIIDNDVDRVDTAKLDNILKDKVDTLFQDFSQMINDIIQSGNISELLEKIIYWGISFSNSKRGSIMVVDKNKELYIYKAIGWDKKEKISDVRIPLGQGIAGKVAAENKRIFVTNIENYDNHDFKFKDKYQTKSFISMPIYGIKKVVAVLNLTDNKNGLYSMNELEMVNVITKLSSRIFELIQIKKKIFNPE